MFRKEHDHSLSGACVPQPSPLEGEADSVESLRVLLQSNRDQAFATGLPCTKEIQARQPVTSIGFEANLRHNRAAIPAEKWKVQPTSLKLLLGHHSRFEMLVGKRKLARRHGETKPARESEIRSPRRTVLFLVRHKDSCCM